MAKQRVEDLTWHMGDRVVLFDGELAVLEAAEIERKLAQFAINVALTEGQRAQEAFWERVRELRPDLAQEWEFIWNSTKKELRLGYRKPKSKTGE